MAPGSEAPAEMLWFIEEKKAISAAEDATHTLHNTYSLRGAKIRDAADPGRSTSTRRFRCGVTKREVIFAQHHWPTWGNERRGRAHEEQRDLYRFINDETLRMANQGMTMVEIAEHSSCRRALPTSGPTGATTARSTMMSRRTYVLYLGWFDGNPATLHELPPVEASKNYVEFMGGADAVLEKARSPSTRATIAGSPRS